NETVWPWYSHIAPISWLTQRDVNTGRSYLNFSEWNDPMNPVDAVVVEVQAGNMPPWFYLPMHPEARLTDAERKELILGLEKSLMCAKP
ncbi:MAG TPA: heme-binding domain-containing protein, partial [Bryobacteraceae bacterium]|nr:heme-binding domain-containing protein [Bryobacteraceae bacterium]